MTSAYLGIKFLHIFVAVVALGSSAGLGIVLEFYAHDRTHGAFVLRAIERVLAVVVFPGYILVLATGLWMAGSAWSFTAGWVQSAIVLWILGAAALGCSLAALRKQRRLHIREETAPAAYRRAFLATRISGGAFGLAVVAILGLMVFKPSIDG